MNNCTHYWYLSPPVNGVVHHRCLKCGAEKDVTVPPLFNAETWGRVAIPKRDPVEAIINEVNDIGYAYRDRW